jgi:hypothetical protein
MSAVHAPRRTSNPEKDYIEMMTKRQREKVQTIISKLDNLSQDKLRSTALLHIAAARSELAKLSQSNDASGDNAHAANAGKANHGGNQLDS